MTDRTPNQALEFLRKGPLRFGDPEQIEAVNQIYLAEQLVGTTHECPECDGEGETADIDDDPEYCMNCGRRCPYCSGSTSTSTECEMCEGEGVVTWKRSTVYAMRVSRILKLLYPQESAAPPYIPKEAA